MGALYYLRQRPDDRCRLLTAVIPAFIVYALFSLEDLNNRDCLPSPHSLAPLFGTLKTSTVEQLNLHGKNENQLDYTNDDPNHDATNQQQSMNYGIPVFLEQARATPPPLPLCAADGSRAKTFLIVFMGHSGSSAIMSELAAHSEVYFEQSEPVDHFEYETNTTLALQWTRDFFERGIKAGRTPGFKIRPAHIYRDPAAWAELARRYDTRIVWQYRENLFKKSVGEYTYRYLNDTSVVEGLRRPMPRHERCRIGAGCKFRIENLRFFHHLLRKMVKSDKEIASAVHMIVAGRDCVHPLPYEDYLYARRAAMKRLLVFLGLKYEEHEPLRHKATSDNMCKTVQNWKDLCANFYACHTWRWQMDDPRNDCHCDFSSGPVKYCSNEFDAVE